MARISRTPISFILSSKNPPPEDKKRLAEYMNSFRERSKARIAKQFPVLIETKEYEP